MTDLNQAGDGYGRVAQGFHWLSFVMLAVLVALGLYCDWIGDGPQRSYLLESWHKPFGILFIFIAGLRLGWRARQPKVSDAPGLSGWEAALSHLTHAGLYFVIFAMPLSGLLMSQGAGRPTPFFHLFDIPQVLGIDPALGPREQYWYIVGKALHEEWFAWALYILFALHVAGALKHQFVDGDRNFLRRMWN